MENVQSEGSAASPETQRGSIPFRVAERVRWEDVDLAGVMRYSAYTRLFDVVEAELLRAAGLPILKATEELSVWLPRKVLTIEYFAPARFDDPLEVIAWVAGVGSSSITIQAEVWSEERRVRHASITVVLVCVDRDTFVKRPLPDELLRLLAPFRIEMQ